MNSITQKLEDLDARNKELAQLIEVAEDKDDIAKYDYKEELYKNKLEMVQLIKNGNNVANVTTLKEEIANYKDMPHKPKFATGINKIDSYFKGGLELSQLVLIGGEKGAGKSAFSLQYLLQVSEFRKSCFLSFEMPKWKMAQRLSKSKPTEKQINNFFLVDKNRDISEIETTITKLAKDGVEFFCIDSLMKITNTALRRAAKHEQLSDITARLSKLAVENNIIIILIVQINKEDLKSGNMAVKGSGDADYDADIMFFINKDKDDHTKRYFVCNKNRQTGNEFKEEVYFNHATISLQEHKPSYMDTAVVTHYEVPQVEMGIVL